jgi:hypothetical protein
VKFGLTTSASVKRSSQTKAGIEHQRSLLLKRIEQAVSADCELEASPEYARREKTADENHEVEEIPDWQ